MTEANLRPSWPISQHVLSS